MNAAKWRLLLSICNCMAVFLYIIPHKYSYREDSEQSPEDFVSPEATNDANCIFRNSSLYRKVYVYPTPGEAEWTGDILSSFAIQDLTKIEAAPWLAVDKEWREKGEEYYDPLGFGAQFATEIIVREMFTHPDSCLRTMNPDEASLFFVPYMSGIEFHSRGPKARHWTTKWGAAVEKAIKGDYDQWERTWGLVSKYWRRRRGADHILVYSSPLQGITHPRYKRGSFHYIHTQHQLEPPIAISIELSTTFVKAYPKCSLKNILLPYPVTDGRYFNGKLDQIVAAKVKNASLEDSSLWYASADAEKALYKSQMDQSQVKPFTQYYRAGVHGACVPLRRALQKDFKCSKSYQHVNDLNMRFMYVYGMRLATFCPTPGGDSPSAKRMFDALMAGCIPVVLSDDFVWPFSNEVDASSTVEPSSFSIRYPGNRFDTVKHNQTCGLISSDDPSLQAVLEKVPAANLRTIREGVSRITPMYEYFNRRKSLPDNPLQSRVLPDGGAALALLRALEERENGILWSDCEHELQSKAVLDEAENYVC